jgi:hypothetical protein
MALNNVVRAAVKNNLKYVEKDRGAIGSIGHFFKKLGYYLTLQKDKLHKIEIKKEKLKRKELNTVAANVLGNLPSHENLSAEDGKVLYTNYEKKYQLSLKDGKIIAYNYEYKKAHKVPIESSIHTIADLSYKLKYYEFLYNLQRNYESTPEWRELVKYNTSELMIVKHKTYGTLSRDLIKSTVTDVAKMNNRSDFIADDIAEIEEKLGNFNDSKAINVTESFLKKNPNILDYLQDIGTGNLTMKEAMSKRISDLAREAGPSQRHRYENAYILLEAAYRVSNPVETFIQDGVRNSMRSMGFSYA